MAVTILVEAQSCFSLVVAVRKNEYAAECPVSGETWLKHEHLSLDSELGVRCLQMGCSPLSND